VSDPFDAVFTQPDMRTALLEQFQIGPRFLDAYLDYFCNAQHVVLSKPGDFHALSPTQKMWLHYALSTNLRGRDIIAVLERYGTVRGARYLDVGCGFGGSIVAAANAGANCVGLELDPERVAFSRRNVADLGLTERVAVLCQDVLDHEAIRNLGRFELATCNDVAEHVEDVPRLFQHLASVLVSGGMIYLEVPNRYSIDSVRSDGHFGLFGITLLDREEARKYHWQRFHYQYDVGHYLSLEDYTDLFWSFGFKPELIASLYHPAADLLAVDEKLRALSEAWEGFQAIPSLDPTTYELVSQAYLAYLTQLVQGLARLRQNPTPSEEVRFCNKYLRDFWTFVAIRQAAGDR